MLSSVLCPPLPTTVLLFIYISVKLSMHTGMYKHRDQGIVLAVGVYSLVHQQVSQAKTACTLGFARATM